MELRHLRYFSTVAEEKHITRAAERLGIQQPPLTQQIQALERELGVVLFHRHARGVALTDAGETFLGGVSEILQMIDRVVEDTRQAAAGRRGRLRIGFTNSAPFHPLLPRVIRAFHETTPEVVLSLEEGGTGELVDGVRARRLDGAFTRSPLTNAPDLVVDELLREPLVIALPAAHPLATVRGKTLQLTLRTLSQESFILYRRPSGPGLYDTIITACRRAGFSPMITQVAPVLTSTLNLVAAGLGVSLVPASLSRHRIDGLAYAAIADRPKPMAPLNLTYLRSANSAAFQRLLTVIRTELQDAPAPF